MTLPDLGNLAYIGFMVVLTDVVSVELEELSLVTVTSTGISTYSSTAFSSITPSFPVL